MVTLEARVVDSTHLELSKPIDTPSGQKVLVSVAETQELLEDREQWARASAEGLQAAFGDSEPEYTVDLVKDPNPSFSPWSFDSP